MCEREGGEEGEKREGIHVCEPMCVCAYAYLTMHTSRFSSIDTIDT